MSCLFPWCSPSFDAQLLSDLETEFTFTRYRDKTQWMYRPSHFRNALRNFQWVKTDGLRIARCAQPNYKGADEIHGFNQKQREFLNANNIKTVISLNSKHHKFASKLMMAQDGIEFHHILTKDFTALSIESHQLIDQIVRQRRLMGGILFYCGYGEGRTGTAIAGFILKLILVRTPAVLVNLSPKQLHKLMTKGFGIEKVEQTESIVKYLREIATVEPEVQGGRPRSLSDSMHSIFVDEPDTSSQASYRSLPALPTGEPPPLPPNKPNAPQRLNSIRMQSLDPVGKLRNSLEYEFGRPPSNCSANGSENTFSRPYLSTNGHINLQSFYFDDISSYI